MHLANLSFTKNIFPEGFKLIQIVQKLSTILCAIGKLLEKAAWSQIDKQFLNNNPYKMSSMEGVNFAPQRAA